MVWSVEKGEMILDTCHNLTLSTSSIFLLAVASLVEPLSMLPYEVSKVARLDLLHFLKFEWRVYSLSYMMHPTFLKVRNHFAMDFSKVRRSVISEESLQDTLESYQCCLFLFVCNSIQPFGVLECCTSSSVRSENLDLISLNAFIRAGQ